MLNLPPHIIAIQWIHQRITEDFKITQYIAGSSFPPSSGVTVLEALDDHQYPDTVAFLEPGAVNIRRESDAHAEREHWTQISE